MLGREGVQGWGWQLNGGGGGRDLPSALAGCRPFRRGGGGVKEDKYIFSVGSLSAVGGLDPHGHELDRMNWTTWIL